MSNAENFKNIGTLEVTVIKLFVKINDHTELNK